MVLTRFEFRFRLHSRNQPTHITIWQTAYFCKIKQNIIKIILPSLAFVLNLTRVLYDLDTE